MLLVAYAISLGFRYLPASARANGGSLSALALPPREDREPVRANWTHAVPVSPFRFTEIARQAGIDFVHVSGMTEAKHFPTAYGSGVAMFDYDNDGKLDLYFATMTFLPPGKVKCGPNRLYRNLGGNRFQDVTTDVRTGLCGLLPWNRRWRHRQRRRPGRLPLQLRFQRPLSQQRRRDIRGHQQDPPGSTGRAGPRAGRSSTTTTMATSTSTWPITAPGSSPTTIVTAMPQPSPLHEGPPPKMRVYCSPRSIQPARHFLYRNNGNQTFTDVTEAAGVGRTDGRGLGVVAADLNDDGRIDLYVANDMCPNFVFLNQGDGLFQTPRNLGCRLRPNGPTRAGMGVDAEDVNGDGLPDLFVTNFWNEAVGLFMNRGEGLFEDRTRTSGLSTTVCSGWAGVVPWRLRQRRLARLLRRQRPHRRQPRQLGTTPRMPNQPCLHRNLEGFTISSSRRATPDHTSIPFTSGGDSPTATSTTTATSTWSSTTRTVAPAVLRNDSPRRPITGSVSAWREFAPIATPSEPASRSKREGRTIVRQRKGGASLESAHDPRLLIGLGDAEVANE